MLQIESLVLPFALLAAGQPAVNSGAITWRWDRESLGCDLNQQTLPGVTPVTVSRSPGTDETIITFVVRSPKFWKGYYPNGLVRLSSGATFPARVQVYSTENRSYRLAATVTDPAFVKALAGASTISISHKEFGNFDAQVRVSELAVAALRSCEDSRLRMWGIDPAILAGLQSRPVPTTILADLFTSFDYPHVGVTNNLNADIIAKLEVAEDGSVRSCTSLGSKKHPQFGDAICKGLKERAHFQPARDANGRPVAAPYVTWAAFRMGAY